MKSTSGTMREPSWIHDDTSTGPSAQSASSPPEGPQPQASQQPQGSTIQPKKMPRSSTGGGASSSTHAAFRSGPSTTPQDQAEPEKDENWTPTEDWMKRKKPSTVEVRLHAAEDYAHQEQNCVLTIRQRFRPFHHRGPSHHSQVRDQFDLETILEKIDISCCAFLQHVDWRTTWFPHDQWERLRMVEALPPYHHVHRICQMQRISSDGGLGNVDIGHWRYGRGWNSEQAQETGEQDWAVHHWEALDGSVGWIGGAGEKQQISHLDGLDLSNEI